MNDLKLNNEERKFFGLMSVQKFNHVLEILGPKVVTSIMRMSHNDLENFETRLNEHIERNKPKTKDWYKGNWIEV